MKKTIITLLALAGVAAAADNARAALEAMGAAQAAAQNVPSYTGKIYQQGTLIKYLLLIEKNTELIIGLAKR